MSILDDPTFGDTDAPVPDVMPGAIFSADSQWAQSPTTVNTAAGSWVGFDQSVPQIFRDIGAAVQTGFGLSMAKDQLIANRDLNKLSLQAQIARAQSDQTLQRYQGQALANQAALQARYPLGVPLGSTRNDQIMIALAIAGIALAYLQLQK